MPLWLQAGFWGLVSGSALLIGAAIGYFARLPQRLIAAIMAFGAGVLISALAFDLMDEAYARSGFAPVALGFVGGAALYTAATYWLNHRGARHRKRSGHHDERQPSEGEHGGSGMAIAAGALLDGIPESIVVGVSLLAGGGVGVVTVVAIFLSNLPEGVSGASGMKRSGRSAGYIFGLWGGIMLSSGVSAVVGNVVFRNFGDAVIAGTTAVAAGAILAMLADTMMPEAFEAAHDLAGLVTALGFLCAFLLTKVAR